MAGIKRTDKKGRILKDNEFQRPDGRYMYRYYGNEKNKKYVYSWKLVPTDATPSGKRDDLSLREKIANIERDRYEGIDISIKNKLTLNNLFEMYTAENNELKINTRSHYFYMYNKYVRNSIGVKKIAAIKYSDVFNYYNNLIINNNLTINSIASINTILHQLFKLAVRNDILLKNPTDGIMSEIKKKNRRKASKCHALTEAQQSAFLNYISNSETYKHWLPLFTVFLGTGCRVGELIGLRWDDCDFKKNIISINHNLVYIMDEDGKSNFHITSPKTENGTRTIPMLTIVKEALLNEKASQQERGHASPIIEGYTNFVFTNRFGQVFVPIALNQAITRIYTDYNKEETSHAELENREPLLLPHFSVHTLRHTFCTRFCENETNIKVIQAIMGHSSITTTMNIYAEATEKKKKEVFENLDNKIKIF